MPSAYFMIGVGVGLLLGVVLDIFVRAVLAIWMETK